MKYTIRENFDFFENNKSQILKEYSGQFVVIADKQIQNHFQTRAEALKYAATEFEIGSFIIQYVTEEDTIVQGFFERVSFA